MSLEACCSVFFVYKELKIVSERKSYRRHSTNYEIHSRDILVWNFNI